MHGPARACTVLVPDQSDVTCSGAYPCTVRVVSPVFISTPYTTTSRPTSMKVNNTIQLLEVSKSVASAVPMVGTQLAAAIDVTIRVSKLVEV